MKNQFVGLHLDFVGFSASMLCAIHCAALPFLLTLAPLAGLQFLDNPMIEYAIILISLFIAISSLIGSYRKHHRKYMALIIAVLGFLFIIGGQLIESEAAEALLTPIGGVAIAVAHLINWRLINQSRKLNTDISE